MLRGFGIALQPGFVTKNNADHNVGYQAGGPEWKNFVLSHYRQRTPADNQQFISEVPVNPTNEIPDNIYHRETKVMTG